MKKQPVYLLLFITSLFFAFTLGFFTGRNYNRETIYLSSRPVTAQHDLPPSEPTVEGTEPAQIVFPIDLNLADIEMLTALPGIGEVLAKRILDYRTASGPFSRPEELLNVEGIGPGKLESILDYISTGG